MNDIRLGAAASDFIWASGIEDTFVPQTRPRHRSLDEYQLIGHYQNWREDIDLATRLGVKALRWGIPWYRVEPLPGELDWRWTDEVIPYMVERGITPIIDLIHYGCPFWLRREFSNEDYPEAVARYSAAVAERYKHLVKWYTPCNEPLVTALLCGRQGAWPPYLHGERGYVRMVMQLTKGMIKTVQAIKQVQPEARMVFVEAASITRAAHPDFAPVAEEYRLKGFVFFDLLTGKVNPEHPLYGWLVSNGARPRDLEKIAQEPVNIDVMGLNFYPQWSTQELYYDEHGKVASRSTEHDGSGFGDMVEDFYRRYGVPVMITETSAKDSEEVRSAWLRASLAMIKQLRANGVPVLGYTWFPMFTMVDWRYRWERGPLDKYLIDLGVYQLANEAGKRWRTLPLAAELRHNIEHPYEAVGDLVVG
jgi:beta-glucosidase/6-phospho-beta-glucosidase/beta-galactosidase